MIQKVDETTICLVDDVVEIEGDELADMYGTQFIDSIDYGAALQVLYTIMASKEVNVEKLGI